MAHKWAKWLPHPCRIGDPHRCRAGGKIRSGPQVGKVATSPLPYWGSPPLQSGGQNQKWPTSGRNGYPTPAVSGIPTASERGDKIRSGPQVGKLATSPLPYRGSPPLQSGGQNQKWPTSGQIGYLTRPYCGSPPLQSGGIKSEVAHKQANWLPHPCRIGDSRRFRAGGKIRSGPQVGEMATSPLPYRGSPTLQSGGIKSEVAHKWAKWLPHPCRIGDPHRFRAGGKVRSGPQVGEMATSPLPYRGSPPLQSGGIKSEVAHKWAKWLPHLRRIGDPHGCRAGGKIRNGPQLGKLATSPLPYWGSPPLQSGGQNQKWPTSGQIGYLTPAVLRIPTASERGDKIRSGPQAGKLATSPLPYRGFPALQSRGQNQKWPTSGRNGYLTTAVSGIPTAAERGDKIRSGPQVGEMATSPLPYRGSPPLQSGGQSQKWPTSGRNGYLTPAVSGIPTASERGDKIRSGPQVGEMATSPPPYRGSPRLQSGGQNQKWPTIGQIGYLTPAVLGIPTASQRGDKIRSGPQAGKLATSPLPYRGSPALQSRGQNQKWPTSGRNGYLTTAVSGIPTASERGDKIRSGPQVGEMATSPLPYRGSPPLQSGGQSQKWPTSGRNGYLTPAVSGIPTASERGDKIRSGPQVGEMATSPPPYRGSPPLQSGGQNQKWPTIGQIGYLTPAVLGIPTASQRGDKIRSGPQAGKLATSALPYRGSPALQSRGQNQKWPTSGQSGYLTPAVSGIPTASERGDKIRSGPQVGEMATSPLPYRGSPTLQSGGIKSEVAHKWANWLPHPCRIGDPHRFRAGGKVRSGPQVGKVATSPLPYRGSPPLQSGGIKSEVTHKWAKWLPHPCRIGDPHRCRAGG